MNPIRTIIVDDEEEAREGIQSLLEKEEDIEILGLAENGLDAIKLIQKHKPDLVFLDIQMPEINGFEVMNSLSTKKLPSVIFVTAFDEYALKAFEVHALDYLLKPFTNERFYQALEIAREQLSVNSIDSQLKELLESYRNNVSKQPNTLIYDPEPSTSAVGPNRLIVKVNGKIRFLLLEELRRIEAQDYYVKLYHKDDTYLIRETMKEMEKMLSGDHFIRIHKSNIVNISFIEEMEPYFSGGYTVTLTTGEELKMSRGYARNISFLQ